MVSLLFSQFRSDKFDKNTLRIDEKISIIYIAYCLK